MAHPRVGVGAMVAKASVTKLRARPFYAQRARISYINSARSVYIKPQAARTHHSSAHKGRTVGVGAVAQIGSNRGDALVASVCSKEQHRGLIVTQEQYHQRA